MHDCYVIDNNGYVILSEHNDTGKYFGELEKRGVYMQSMIQMGIFKQLTVYDFQALCSEEIEIKSDARLLITVCIYTYIYISADSVRSLKNPYLLFASAVSNGAVGRQLACL